MQAGGNAELRAHVLHGEISPDVFVHMTSEELASKVRFQHGMLAAAPQRTNQAAAPCTLCKGGSRGGPLAESAPPASQTRLYRFCHKCLLPRVPPALPLQDLKRWRQTVREEGLRQAVLPPDLAARISTAAAVQMKKEG